MAEVTSSINVNADASTIYEGGALFEIKADDLKNNDIAIKQLINSHNLQAIELKKLGTDIIKKESQIEFLQTSPFISITALIGSSIAAIIIGIGVNILTSDSNTTLAYTLLVLGGLLTLCCGLSNILYPYAKNFFNKEKK